MIGFKGVPFSKRYYSLCRIFLCPLWCLLSWFGRNQ